MGKALVRILQYSRVDQHIDWTLSPWPPNKTSPLPHPLHATHLCVFCSSRLFFACDLRRVARPGWPQLRSAFGAGVDKLAQPDTKPPPLPNTSTFPRHTRSILACPFISRAANHPIWNSASERLLEFYPPSLPYLLIPDSIWLPDLTSLGHVRDINKQWNARWLL